MRYGLSVPCFGTGLDAALVAQWARSAEDAGWDGFFLWDHLFAFAPGPIDVVDPFIALAAAACCTEKIRLGTLVTPLPRRRPLVVARQTVTLDRLSRGRLVLGVGTGAGPFEWDFCGEETAPAIRGDMLDEHLELLNGLWTGLPVRHEGRHYRVAGQQWAGVCPRRRCSSPGSRSGWAVRGPGAGPSPEQRVGTAWCRCGPTAPGR